MSDLPDTRSTVITAAQTSRLAPRLHELEHFAGLGRLSASLLHEISNPLAAALLYLEQHDNRESTPLRQARHNILLLKRYVEAARQQVRHEGIAGSFCVRQQLDQVRRVLLPLARHRRVRLRIEATMNYKLYGDPVKFQHILTNLIMNAVDAYDGRSGLPAQRPVSVRLTSRQQWLHICVNDQGRGIAADRLTDVFKPFYTTKQRGGHGLGIGLAVVKQYVEEDFYGTVTVASVFGQGTEFNAKLRLTPRYHARI